MAAASARGIGRNDRGSPFHWGKLFLFAILSMGDYYLTWRLLQLADSSKDVYESNPVANAWLADYGWMGLVFFKATMVLLIGTVSVVLSCHRPRTGGLVLTLACLVTMATVLYSAAITAALYYEPVTKIVIAWNKG